MVSARMKCFSDRNVHYVAVLHNVVLTLQAQRAFGARICFRARFEKLVPADGFGPDEMFFRSECALRRRLAQCSPYPPGATCLWRAHLLPSPLREVGPSGWFRPG